MAIKDLARQMLTDKNVTNKEHVLAILNKPKHFIAVPQTFMSKASRMMFDEEWYPGQNPPKPQKRKYLQFKQNMEEECLDDYLGPKIPSLLEFLENKIRMREINGELQTKSSIKKRSGECRLEPIPPPHIKPVNVIQEEPLATQMRRKDVVHNIIKFESEQLRE